MHGKVGFLVVHMLKDRSMPRPRLDPINKGKSRPGQRFGQAHVFAAAELSQLQLLGAGEHDALGCIHDLLVPCLGRNLHPSPK